MAAGDPTEVAIPANTWTKVLTNVKTCSISILYPTNNEWYWTQNATGTGLPVETPQVKLNFQTSELDSDVLIDFYVYVKESAGKVRVI